jgi:hypothetical protein
MRDSDQVDLTDEESRIIPTGGGKNFRQAYNEKCTRRGGVTGRRR